MNKKLKSLFFFGISIFNALCGFLLSILLVHYLTPNEFGVYTYIVSIATLAASLYGGISTLTINSILNTTTVSQVNFNSRQSILEISNIIIFFAPFLVLIGLLLSFLINRSFFYDYYDLILFSCFAIPLRGLLYLIEGVARSNGKDFLASFSNNWGKSIINIILIYTVIPFLPKPLYLNSIIFIYTLSFLLSFLISLYQVSAGLSLIRTIDRNLFQDFFTINKQLFVDFFSLSIIVSLPVINGNIDLQMLALFDLPENLGFYSLAKTFGAFCTLPLLSTTNFIKPYIKKTLVKNDFISLKRLTKNTSRFAFFICTLVSCLLIVFGNVVITIFYGVDYLPSYTILLFLLPGYLINTFTGPSSFILLSSNSSGIVLKATALSVLINIICNFLLIPQYGPQGAAISTSISVTLMNVISVCSVYRKFKFLSTAF